MNFTEAIKSFILACKADGLSLRTVESYETRLKPFSDAIGNCSTGSITVDDLRAVIADLYERDLSPYTIHGHIRALKRLFRWLADEGYISENPALRIRLPRLPQAPPKAIADDDFRRLLQAAMTIGEEWERKRNTALLLFLADTGCRLGGILSLKVSGLDLEARTARVQEKGGQWRFVFLLPITVKTLAIWLEARATVITDTDAVWVAKDGHPLNRWGIQSILRRLRKRARVRGPAGAHSFRHRFAIHYLMAGGDLASLADLLGHRDVETTKQYYARFRIQELQEKHDRFSPALSLLDTLEIS